ncbi:hypothetical protein QAD02_011484 [Eretmocerus hayati]|uniref:Uncharacterized protein n=1 Tax=Eretmocerus hayati TaxID=131215 RepID=A0ACC2NWV9_9HYME|nr:hypothetical protein QAD02_011484 [Eretmocerus hayati]
MNIIAKTRLIGVQKQGESLRRDFGTILRSVARGVDHTPGGNADVPVTVSNSQCTPSGSNKRKKFSLPSENAKEKRRLKRKGLRVRVQRTDQTPQDAIVVKQKPESATYAETLELMKSKVDGAFAGGEFNKTEAADIRDIDLDTTSAEVARAIQDALPDGGNEEVTFKVLRPAYRGTQLSVPVLSVAAAEPLLQEGHIRIGWVNARIKERESQRALHFGKRETVRDPVPKETEEETASCQQANLNRSGRTYDLLASDGAKKGINMLLCNMYSGYKPESGHPDPQ